MAANAYVGNMKQVMSANTTVGSIEVALADSTNTTGEYAVTTETTISDVNVWAFNANTGLMIEHIIQDQSITSTLSSQFNKHALNITINRQYDVPFFFGYSNTASGTTGMAYYSQSGNYLSGTKFDSSTALAATSGSVAIECAIYGEGSENVEEDAVDSLTQIAVYNSSASSKMAGNCYVANSTQTVPANTKISVLDVMVTGTKISGVNIYVVNGNNNTIVEMLADEQTMTPIYSSRLGADVIRLNVNKTYTYPVYFMFNAERTNNSSNAMLMVSNATGSILLTDDEKKPAVGDVLSDFTEAYNIGHAIYS